jgi:acyl-coenzyme A thioesterase PaaI-like protein
MFAVSHRFLGFSSSRDFGILTLLLSAAADLCLALRFLASCLLCHKTSKKKKKSLEEIRSKIARRRAKTGRMKKLRHSREIGLDGIECFVCATRAANPQGLDLQFEETENGALTLFRLPQAFQSYPGFLHGGIVAAILDETMAYGGVFRYGCLPLTRKMTLSYRRGVDAEKEHRCESQIVSESEGAFTAKASVSLPGRGNLVLAEADFILPTMAQAERLMPGAERHAWIKYFR